MKRRGDRKRENKSGHSASVRKCFVRPLVLFTRLPQTTERRESGGRAQSAAVRPRRRSPSIVPAGTPRPNVVCNTHKVYGGDDESKHGKSEREKLCGTLCVYRSIYFEKGCSTTRKMDPSTFATHTSRATRKMKPISLVVKVKRQMIKYSTVVYKRPIIMSMVPSMSVHAGAASTNLRFNNEGGKDNNHSDSCRQARVLAWGKEKRTRTRKTYTINIELFLCY